MVPSHRVTVERTYLSKETYTVKHPRKIFPYCDVFQGVLTHVWGLWGELFELNSSKPFTPTTPRKCQYRRKRHKIDLFFGDV